MRDIIFLGYNSAEVRCYSVPGSVRGRKIDDYLNLGWYYYGHQLYGVQGTATMMTVKVESSEGRLLARLFDETFDLLWNHPDTRKVDIRSGEVVSKTVPPDGEVE